MSARRGPVAPADSFEARAARVKARLSEALPPASTGTVNSQASRTHRADDVRTTSATPASA